MPARADASITSLSRSRGSAASYEKPAQPVYGIARARTRASGVGFDSATSPATRRNASPRPCPAMRGAHAARRDSMVDADAVAAPHEGLTVRCARTVRSPRRAVSS